MVQPKYIGIAYYSYTPPICEGLLDLREYCHRNMEVSVSSWGFAPQSSKSWSAHPLVISHSYGNLPMASSMIYPGNNRKHMETWWFSIGLTQERVVIFHRIFQLQRTHRSNVRCPQTGHQDDPFSVFRCPFFSGVSCVTHLEKFTWLWSFYETTVDGRNPAPVDRWFIPLLIGFQPSKVMQDFFHPQYHTIMGWPVISQAQTLELHSDGSARRLQVRWMAIPDHNGGCLWSPQIWKIHGIS